MHSDLWLQTNIKYLCHHIANNLNQTEGGGLGRGAEYSASTVVVSRERGRRRPFSHFAVTDLILMNGARV